MEALVLIDIQNDYFKGGRFPLRRMRQAAANAAGLLEAFREKGKPVIHIRHIAIRNPIRFFEKDTPGAEINTAVAPLENEKVFVKHYPNSFRETGLDGYLKQLGVEKIHVAGAMTNMCVDSTVRAGFDLGYRMIIHKNACAAAGFLGTGLVHAISIKTLAASFACIED